MGKLRVHELAKELGKENKDIIETLSEMGVPVTSHMSTIEDNDCEKIRRKFVNKTMTKEPENINENKSEAAGTEAKPKKKNIIQVFRPQNSKTGMVRPGQRPGQRPAGPGAARPQGARPQGAARPQGQAAGRPQAPGARPANPAAQTRPAAPARPQEAAVKAQEASQVRPAQSGAPAAQEKPAAPAKPQEAAVKAPETAKEPVQNTAAAAQASRPVQSAAPAENAQSAAPKAQTTGQTAAKAADQPKSQQSQPAARSQGQGSRAPQGAGRAQGERRTQDGSQNRSQGQSYSRSQSDNRSRDSRAQGDRRTQDGGQNRSQGQSYSRNQSDNRSRDGRTQGDRFQNNRGQEGRYQNQRNDRNQGDKDWNQNERGQSRSQNSGRMPSIPKAPMESKPLEKEGRVKNERGSRNDRRNEKPEKGDKLDRMERNKQQNQKNNAKGKVRSKAPAPVQKPVEKEEVIKNIILPETLTIKELAEKMKVQPAVIVKKLFLQGTMVTVNQEIDYDTAEEIALEFNCICEKEEKVDVLEELLKEEEDPEDTLVTRPPVVCVMGHVDHGKTSLLDAIRNTHVIDREAGGITQHIGASVVTCNGEKITFLDTPGHEAFTAMRMRGANSTDIAILVVAADDGVMPQTVEAINHAKAAGIEIIVAVNKIDKPSANVERVKQELTEYQLIPEDWGGSTVFVPVSAKTHEGIDTLLEMVLLTAEVLELKANPRRRARGLVIEAQLDKGRGPVATVLVQKGVLHVGDPICAGSCYGKVRAMMDDKGRKVKEAGPSTPVEILGFSDVPGAGEIFISPETEKEARSFAETFISEGREKLLEDTKAKMSLDDLFSQIQAGNLKELNLIVKADVQGSVEAVKQSLLKLSNEEVVVKIIHGGVGAINESDVILASASNAIIIGFNVRPDAMAKSTAEREGVDVRLYRVIYDAIADVEAAMKGMLDPIFEEKIIGHAEVRQTFKASGVGTIAGAYVLDGVFQRGCSARITREGVQIFDGALASLKRFKDDVKEVKAGYECGLVFEKFNDIKEEDRVEAYIMVEVPR